MFHFELLQPYIDDENITDIDTNSRCVYVTHQTKGRYKVMNLKKGYLEDMLTRISNYPQINKEFNYHNPILDGTMDGVRIHAVHQSVMHPNCWLSIRKNPIELQVLAKDYEKIFKLLKVANQLKWSYIFGGERGSGKTQWTRSSIALLDEILSVSIIAENDEMHMLELFPERLISQYIVNDIINYKTAAASVLRDNSDYVVFQEVRDQAIDDLLLILSSSSRVLSTIHLKNALLMPQRMIQLSEQKNDEHLLSKIHDYVQMCIVPMSEVIDGNRKYWISEIALFWNDQDGNPQKQLIFISDGVNEQYLPFPTFYQTILKQNHVKLSW